MARRVFTAFRLFVCAAILLSTALARCAWAHEDPPGCFVTSAVVIVSVFRADGSTGVVGSISECETINYRATISKATDLDSECAFSQGSFSLTTPDGVVHVINANLPCVGGNTGLEGCDDAVNDVRSELIPYTVRPRDVIGGFIKATANYSDGVAHDAPNNTPGIVAVSVKSTPVLFCDDHNLCTVDVCDPTRQGPGACANIPIVCDDNDLCTAETCNPASGECVFSPQKLCDDGNLCTSDACDPATGNCVFTPSVVCDDNDPCTSETCNPTTGVCDVVTQTCNDNDPCTLDTCDHQTGACSNVPAPFPGCASCGDNIVGGQEQCDLGAANGRPDSCCTSRCTFRPTGEICRPLAGICDMAETCSGASATCPAVDAKKPSGSTCPADALVCTLDQCDGSHDACQHPPGNAGTVCRSSAGECDPADVCDGVSAGCPDVRSPAHTPCTADDNLCTRDECNGFSAACKHSVMPDGSVCRPARPDSFGCDTPELCEDAVEGGICPPDLPAPEHTPCSAEADDNNPCTDQLCDGNFQCRIVTLPRFTLCGDDDTHFCDVANDGSGVCRSLPSPHCGTQVPPHTDTGEGEQCDDGTANGTIGSCCTFECQYKPAGRECSTLEIPQGVCNGTGSCKHVGECGNGVVEDVSFVGGTAMSEQCDLGDMNGKGQYGGSCCKADCTFRESGFLCRDISNTCEVRAECPGDQGECPPNRFEPDTKPCADGNACTVEDHCSTEGGTCVGTTNICHSLDTPTREALTRFRKGKLQFRVLSDMVQAGSSVAVVGSATAADLRASGADIPTDACAADVIDADREEYRMCKSENKELKKAGSPVRRKCKPTACLAAFLKKNKTLRSFSIRVQALYDDIRTGDERNGVLDLGQVAIGAP